MLKVNF
jgi:hypothetical protein